MPFKWYILALMIGIIGPQFFFERIPKKYLYPLASWNLFAQLPNAEQYRFLYFENIHTGQECYFYICPNVDQTAITPYHPFNLVRWGRAGFDEADVQSYFKDKLDLESLGYRVKIKTEATTLAEKWKELSKQIPNRQ